MLSEVTRDFILHWGEMGTRWGVNRSVAQIHALLFLAEAPLPADAIVESLGLARSNVSNSLKELQSWQLVQVRHVMGDRREHFVAVTDIAEVFRLIVEGRKQREIDPTLQALRRFASAAEAGHEPHVQTRIAEVIDWQIGAFGGQALASYQTVAPDNAAKYKDTSVGGRVSYGVARNVKVPTGLPLGAS